MAEKYYKGNNIGLTFDGTGWKLNNLPQNFINPEAFSTKDPVFPKVPTTPPTTTEPEKDPCPPGYIFDKALNQCVPDPNYQTDFLGQPQRTEPTGTDSTKAEYIDFDASTSEGRKDMYDHALKQGYINEKGELLGPPKAPTIGMMTPIAQFGITRQYNRWLKELGRYDALMKEQGLPTGFIQAIGMAPRLTSNFYTQATAELKGGVFDKTKEKPKGKTLDEALKELREEEEKKEQEQKKQQEIQERIKEKQIEERKKTIGQTGGPAGGGFIPKPPTGQTGGPAGMGSPPPNTSPIGGTGQTYAQFKGR